MQSPRPSPPTREMKHATHFRSLVGGMEASFAKILEDGKHAHLPFTGMHTLRGGDELGNAPLAINSSFHNKKAHITHAEDGAMRVTHCEMISVFPTVATTATIDDIRVQEGRLRGFYIQPGNSHSFPMLSGLVNNFDTYRFERLSFHVMPMVAADHSGSIFMAVDPDPTDPAPSTEMEMSGFAMSTAASIWQPNTLHTNSRAINPVGPRRFIRGDFEPTGDPKLDDSGILWISHYAISAGIPICVFATYDVVLSDIQTIRDDFWNADSTEDNPAVNVGRTNPFGDGPIPSTSPNVFGVEYVSTSVGQQRGIKFPRAGRYKVDTTVGGTGLSAGMSIPMTASTPADQDPATGYYSTGSFITGVIELVYNGAVLVNSTTAAVKTVIVDVFQTGTVLMYAWNSASTLTSMGVIITAMALNDGTRKPAPPATYREEKRRRLESAVHVGGLPDPPYVPAPPNPDPPPPETPESKDEESGWIRMRASALGLTTP